VVFSEDVFVEMLRERGQIFRISHILMEDGLINCVDPFTPKAIALGSNSVRRLGEITFVERFIYGRTMLEG
jgi:hypothetical protein